MRKSRGIFTVFLAMVFVFGMCLNCANARHLNNTPIYLDSTAATFTGDAVYDADNDVIKFNVSDSKATYTVEEGTRGIFDIYLEVSKRAMPFGTTPLSISVNDGEITVPIIDYGTATYDAENMVWLDLYDKGLFLCLKHVALKPGDTVTITALPGFHMTYNGKVSSYAPYIGDIILYRPGEKVAVGYEGVLPEKEHMDPRDPLSGLKLVWLGSSVTYGLMAKGYSMADYLEDEHSRLESYKYTVSGTTLVDDNPSSYVSRMKYIPKNLDPDFFIVQLSTNDATLGKPLGELSDSYDINAFDTGTIYGAMEYIIVYASRTWHCPVLFYTGSYFENANGTNDEAYADMVEVLLDIQEKWGIDVIDLYNDAAMTDLYLNNQDLYKQYMSTDGIHPKADGYSLWWGPKFEDALTSYVTECKYRWHGHRYNWFFKSFFCHKMHH